MLNLNLAVFDKDNLYAQKLSHYLLSITEYSFSVQVFSKFNLLQDFLNNHSIDILLIDSNVFKQGIDKLQAEVVILLTDGCIETELRKMLCINKLQAAKAIVKEMIRIYTHVCDKELIGGGSGEATKLICIYSPVGGCGKTTISIALGRALARKKVRTIYIGMEEFSSCRGMLKGDFEEGLSDILYYISKSCENMAMKLQGLRERDEKSGLFFIPPASFGGELLEFDAKAFVDFIQEIVRSREYDVIILDLSCHLSIVNKMLLEECDKRIYIVPNTDQASIKWLEYLKQRSLETNVSPVDFHEKGDAIWVLNRLYFSGEERKIEEEITTSYLEIPFVRELQDIKDGEVRISAIDALEEAIK